MFVEHDGRMVLATEVAAKKAMESQKKNKSESAAMRTPPQVAVPRAQARADRALDKAKTLQRMEQAQQSSREKRAERRAERAARKATSGEPAPSRFQEAVREGSIAVSDATTAAPATPSVVDLPEGSKVETVGAVTRYQPQGDPFTYEYDASTQSFSAFTLDGTPVVTGVTEDDPAYGEFLKHAKGGRTSYYGGGSAAPKAPGAEAPAAEVEAESTVDEFGNVNYGESSVEDEVSIPERGDTAMSPEARPDTSMTDDADALPQGNTLLGPTAGALAARGAGRAAMAGAEEAATRGGRVAREAATREGLEQAEQLRRMKAAGETRGRISYAQQLMEGKRGSAPSTRAGISKQLIDEVVDDISPDDLSPELRRYYDNFDAKTLRQLDLDPADKYLVARLKQNAGSREAAAAAEFFGEAVDDKAAQSLGTKLRIPSAPTSQQLREGAESVFRGARTAAARVAANPAQAARVAGRGAMAAMSLIPDPTDIAMLAASAPVLGLYELGAREDFGRQLDLIAPRRGAAEREPFTLDQLSNAQKQDVREFVLNSPQPLSAAKELLEMRRYITDEALAEIIAE